MKYFGAHISIAGGVEYAPERAKEIGANAFAMFCKNQRQWKAKPYSKEQIKIFKQNLEGFKINPGKVLVHDSYLINLGSPNKEARKKSIEAFIDEAVRIESLGLKLLNFHPGSHLNKIDEGECLSLIADGVEKAMKETDEVVFVLENTAGQGSNLGFKFEHLKAVIARIKNKKRIGVCLDTCHAHAAGYDLASSKKKFEQVMQEFQQIVDFKYLKGMHLNDSKTPFESRKDRHENLGQGSIGKNCFKWIAQDPRFDDIPLILETPKRELWPKEIQLLRSLM